MSKPLAVLIVEDNESDAQLVVRKLTKAGYSLSFERVVSAAQMRIALQKQAWGIVISDYSLPGMDGFTALKVLHETGQDIPFIVVSGTMGEETAVDMMKAGAHDYVIKEDLAGLVPAVERELNQAKVRLERKRVDETLRDSEVKYRRLFEDAAIGVFHSNFAGRFLDVNPALARMLGYDSPQEVIDSIYSISEQVYVDPHQRTKNMEDAHAKGKAVVTENRYRRKDGTQWTGNLILRQVLDNRGQPEFLEGFVEDITERKRSEESFRESEARFKAVSEYSHNAICLIDEKGKIIWINEAFIQMSGYTKDQIYAASSFVEYLAPESIEFVTNNFTLFVKNEPYEHHYNFYFIGSDGVPG